MRSSALLSIVGKRLAEARRQLALSVPEAARRAGVSARYLRMAEAGQANLSLLKLAALAGALRVPLRELCDVGVGDAPELRLALLGVRGAGKSTVGRALAQRLEVPFFELDDLVEQRAGLPLGQIFTIHGEAHYRELQREVLEDWLAQHGSGVLAAGGSIVEDEKCYRRVCDTCRTVWLRARPEEHWQRVVQQGDLRPMRGNPRAMAELKALIDHREPLYATADLTVDTSERAPPLAADDIARWATGG